MNTCPKCNFEDVLKCKGWRYSICQSCGHKDVSIDNIKHILGVAGEECAELAQVLSKASRFGPDNTGPGQMVTNKQRIISEFHDLVGAIDMLVDVGVFTYEDINLDEILVHRKKCKIEAMMSISKEKGWL